MVLLAIVASVAALAWQPALLGAEIPYRYEGTLLGVKANLLLFRKTERAVVTLKGIPLGGCINGVARFENDGFGVELDKELEAALRQRHVKIEGVGAFHDYSKVFVIIKLPLGMGRYTMSLDRKC